MISTSDCCVTVACRLTRRFRPPRSKPPSASNKFHFPHRRSFVRHPCLLELPQDQQTRLPRFSVVRDLFLRKYPNQQGRRRHPGPFPSHPLSSLKLRPLLLVITARGSNLKSTLTRTTQRITREGRNCRGGGGTEEPRSVSTARRDQRVGCTAYGRPRVVQTRPQVLVHHAQVRSLLEAAVQQVLLSGPWIRLGSDQGRGGEGGGKDRCWWP